MSKKVFLILVLPILAGAVFYIAGNYSKCGNLRCIEEVKLQLPTSPAVSPPETQIPSNDTANWKTYRDEKRGFEFKYPSDVGVLSALDMSFTGELDEQKESPSFLLIGDRSGTFVIQIDRFAASILKGKDDATTQQIVASYKQIR